MFLIGPSEVRGHGSGRLRRPLCHPPEDCHAAQGGFVFLEADFKRASSIFSGWCNGPRHPITIALAEIWEIASPTTPSPSPSLADLDQRWTIITY